MRSAAVDDDLLTALGVPAGARPPVRKGETDVIGPPPAAGRAAAAAAASCILSHELWQSAFGGQPMVGQTIEINGLPREVIGIMPPGADVMDNRTEIWLPLGLNPAQPSEPRQPLSCISSAA